MLIEILLVLVVLFVLLYRYVTKHFGRWDQEGIPNKAGSFPYGSHKEMFYQTLHLNECISEDYKEMKMHDFTGWYLFGKPILSINNLDHVKNVLVKDFDHFVDRGSENMQKAMRGGGKYDAVWARQLTNLNGDEWKDARSTFSPIFTSGKMKGMLNTIKMVGDLLVNELDSKAKSKEDFELKEVFGKFSLDSLASCAFGVDAESFNNKESKFVSYAARIFQNNFWDMLKFALKMIPITRGIMNALKIDIVKPKQTRFFKDIVTQTVAHRRRTGERKNDLIDLMLDCMKDPGAQEEEATKADSNWSQYEEDMKLKQHTGRVAKIDEDVMVATAIVILVAGYDTTGMTLSYMSYYLAKNPDVQEKLQEEIDEAYDAAGGKLPDYTVLQNLPYLEKTILETLRMQSPVGVLLRVCTKDYTFPGTNLTVKKDDMVSVPVIGIHHDEDIYPNPDLFNPENFSKEAKSERSPYAFLPFGQGPRACIGMRFALLEAKVAMALVLRKFTFHNSPKNPEKLMMDPTSQLGYIKNGIWARVSPRT